MNGVRSPEGGHVAGPSLCRPGKRATPAVEQQERY